MAQAFRPVSRSFSLLGLSALLLSLAFGTDAEKPKLAPDERCPPWRDDARRLGGARTELARLEGAAPQHADMWAYVDAPALAAGGERERALERLDELQKEHPASAWLHKGALRDGGARARLGHGERAESISRGGSRAVARGDRQRELARIYLDFADALSTEESGPSAEPRKLDYGARRRSTRRYWNRGAARSRRLDDVAHRLLPEQLGQFEIALALARRVPRAFPDATRADASAAREGAGAHVSKHAPARAGARCRRWRARARRAGVRGPASRVRDRASRARADGARPSRD